jgi:predicted transcriptional regulator
VGAVGLSRVLVRHHLRMLEAHRLVRATVWRRRRTYALAGAGSGLAACELKDETRRRVASAVAHFGGATQKDLARALGLSQRLVSYHLARLGDSALVRAEGRNPRVYVGTPALAHALANEEGLGHARDEARPGLEKEGEGVMAAAAVATTA